MFYEIIPSKNHIYESLVNDTLKEYDKFFGVSYSKENFTFIIAKDLEQYRNVTNIKADYAVANANHYNKLVYVTKHEAIKNKYSNEDYKNLLRHEISHIYMDRYMWGNRCLPMAFSEGFATFISNQIKGRTYNENLYTLFDKNVAPMVFYTGGGFFIEYLINTYKKEKFLKFLELNRKTNTQDGWKKHFKSVYKKTHSEVLNEMLIKNSFLGKKYSIPLFKKYVKDKVNEYKENFAKIFNIDLANFNISCAFTTSQDELKKKYFKIFKNKRDYHLNFLYDIKNSEITFFVFNPLKTFFKKEYYCKNIAVIVYELILRSSFLKNNISNIPNWIINGTANYFAYGIDSKTNPKDRKDMVKKVFHKNNNFYEVNASSGLFVKYIIKTYKKEKFIKFLKSLESITSKKQIEESFKAIYKKGFKEMLKEI